MGWIMLICLGILLLVVGAVLLEQETTYLCDRAGCLSQLDTQAFRASAADRTAREAGWTYDTRTGLTYCPTHAKEHTP